MSMIQSLSGNLPTGPVNPDPIRAAADTVLSRAGGQDADRIVAELRNLDLSGSATFEQVSREIVRSLPPIEAARVEIALTQADYPMMPAAQSRQAEVAATALKNEGLVTDQDIAWARGQMHERETMFSMQTRGQPMPSAAADGVFMEAAEIRAAARMEMGQVNVGENGRTLQPREVAAVQRIFGKSVDITNVTVVNGSNGNPIAATAFKQGNPAITIGDTIYLNTSSRLVRNGLSQDLSRSADGVATLAHEMNHVRQYQHASIPGVFARIGAQAVIYGKDGAYEYYTRDRSFGEETLEAQSQIVGDYARYRETGTLPVYDIGEVRRTVSGAALEQWAVGSNVYGK